MKRRAFNLLTVFSLLLFTGIAALWVRSYFVTDLIVWENQLSGQSGESQQIWNIGGGGVDWMIFRYGPPAPGAPTTHYEHHSAVGNASYPTLRGPSTFARALGFGFDRAPRGAPDRRREYRFPFYALAVIPAILPLLWLRHRLVRYIPYLPQGLASKIFRVAAKCLFGAGIVTSFLAGIAVAALGVRSYWHGDIMSYKEQPNYVPWIELNSNSGRFMFTFDNSMEETLDAPAASWSYSSQFPNTVFGPYDPLSSLAGLTRPISGVFWSRYGFTFYLNTAYPGFSLDISGGTQMPDPDPETWWAGVVVVPHWFLSAVLMLPSAIWVYLYWKRRRRPAGGCAVCGYDLRASKERCPECGTPIPSVVENTTQVALRAEEYPGRGRSSAPESR